MSNDFEYRVWIGCLGCYNEGRLTGEWFDADSIPDSEAEWLDGLEAKPKPHYGGGTHEELWVMDHENSPVEGEYGMSTARQYAEWLADIDHEVRPELIAYISHAGEFTEDTVSEFQDSYLGVFDEIADAYEDDYPESELPSWAKQYRWTILREMEDEMINEGWWTEDAPMGKVYVFRP